MEIFLIILGIVVLLTLGIIIRYLIATEFYIIAKEKGYKKEKYLWIPFLLGIAGYLLVVALPNHSNTQNIDTIKRMSNSWKCSKCGRENPSYTGTCACGNSKENKKTTYDDENNLIISKLNGSYKKIISLSEFEEKTVYIKIQGDTYKTSEWINDGKINWSIKDKEILYGIKEKTNNAPYTLTLKPVENGIDITGFPDEVHNGIYIKE